MPKDLIPRQWPHFMEKKSKREYISSKILGQLYDHVQRVDFVPLYEAPFDGRVLTAYPDDISILRTARQVKTQYDIALRRIMAQQEIETEFEVWSTFVLSKPRVGSDYKTQENMGIIETALKARFRSICIESAGAETSKDFDKMGPFVASMYQVTYEEMKIALDECHATIMVGGKQVPKRKMEPKYMPLISFPWLFHDVLGRIATGIADRQGLEDLGLPFLATKAQPKTSQLRSPNIQDDKQIVETIEGVIFHRGELLDISWPDNVDSEGDDIEQPYNQPTTIDEVKKKDNIVEPVEFNPLYDVSPPTTPKRRTSRIGLSLALEPSDLHLPTPANHVQQLSNSEGPIIKIIDQSQTSMKTLNNFGDLSMMDADSTTITGAQSSRSDAAGHEESWSEPRVSPISVHSSMDGVTNPENRIPSLVNFEEEIEQASSIGKYCSQLTPNPGARKSSLADLEEMISTVIESLPAKYPTDGEEVFVEAPNMDTDLEKLDQFTTKGHDRYHVPSSHCLSPNSFVCHAAGSIAEISSPFLVDFGEALPTITGPGEEVSHLFEHYSPFNLTTTHQTSGPKNSFMMDLEEMISPVNDLVVNEHHAKDHQVEEEKVILEIPNRMSDFEKLDRLVSDDKLDANNRPRPSRTPCKSRKGSPNYKTVEGFIASL